MSLGLLDSLHRQMPCFGLFAAIPSTNSWVTWYSLHCFRLSATEALLQSPGNTPPIQARFCHFNHFVAPEGYLMPLKMEKTLPELVYG